jgi:2-polyprenyl-6-methoxyphenol hydroxylase-like FAD-dependent oxidoreductase
MPRQGAPYNEAMRPPDRLPAVSFDVSVHGGGPVGRATALALAHQGLRVALAAQPRPTAREDLRTYALNAASVQLLASLKVWDALPADARTPVYDMQVQGDAPGHAVSFSAWQQGVAQLAFIVDAGALEAALADAVRFAPHVQEVPPDAAPEAPLKVLAEGRDARLRDALGARMALQAYGHRGVAARLVASVPHAGRARQWFRHPDVLALLPFDRPEPDASYGLVWSVPTERAEALCAMPVEAFEAELQSATEGAAGVLRLAGVGTRAHWPLALGRAANVCGPGWVLVGDAAHLVHPLAGQGLNLGLGDVADLASVLAAREGWRSLGDERLLQRYARRREWPVRLMGGVTDGLWHLFSRDEVWLRALRNRGLTLVDRLGPVKRALARRALGT